MSNIPEELRYTREHEWIRLDGDEGEIGITDYAQGELGDIVFVELPEVGAEVTAGESFGTIEAVKTVEDLYAPVSGEITAVNEALTEDAVSVNSDPYGEGWMIRVKIDDPDSTEDLLTAEAYAQLLED